MLQDAQGLDVTTRSPDAIAAINHWIDQSLGYGKAVEAEALCAIAHAYAAAHYLSQENTVNRQRALPYVTTAQRYTAGVTTREQWYIAAIAAWSQRAVPHAIALHEAIANQFPTDLISVQQEQYHYFYRGQHEHLLHLAERVLPANSERPFLLGMVAFGLEQCHQLRAAETMAHRAIAIHRQDPWAHHALAHVMETQQRPADGIAQMERHADSWEQCNSMLYTHNWWYVALHYLALGDTATVLQLYDQRIWGRAQQHLPKDQVGAIATLLRLELHGAEVGDRWQAIAAQLQPRIGEHFLPFQDLHYSRRHKR